VKLVDQPSRVPVERNGRGIEGVYSFKKQFNEEEL